MSNNDVSTPDTIPRPTLSDSVDWRSPVAVTIVVCTMPFARICLYRAASRLYRK